MPLCNSRPSGTTARYADPRSVKEPSLSRRRRNKSPVFLLSENARGPYWNLPAIYYGGRDTRCWLVCKVAGSPVAFRALTNGSKLPIIRSRRVSSFDKNFRARKRTVNGTEKATLSAISLFLAVCVPFRFRTRRSRYRSRTIAGRTRETAPSSTLSVVGVLRPRSRA